MYRAIPLLILLALTAPAAGCVVGFQEETALFEEAETRYARGDYDGAAVLYAEFLEIHPLSPLADIAEQRLLTIDRELDAIMGRRGTPAPVYVNPFGTQVEAPGDSVGFAPVEAPQMPTFGR